MERMRATPVHLCRQRYFGDEQRWGFGFLVHPAAFDELMPQTLATATVDRLLHHAHVAGESNPAHYAPARRCEGT